MKKGILFYLLLCIFFVLAGPLVVQGQVGSLAGFWERRKWDMRLTMEIRGNEGICIYVSPEKYKGWLNQIILKDIREKKGKLLALKAIRKDNTGELLEWKDSELRILDKGRKLRCTYPGKQRGLYKYLEYNKIEEKELVALKKQRDIRRREMEALRAKKEKERKEAHERYVEFVKRSKITDWPSMETLSVNPFIYENKVVGIVSGFEMMISATEGLFEGDDEPFVVSKIPRGLLKSKGNVVLAARVLGKKETKLPLLGTVLLPHLQFVDVYICKSAKCRDIILGD